MKMLKSLKIAIFATATALLFAAASAASAGSPTIPVQFQGSWCDPSSNGSMNSIPLRRCTSDDLLVFHIRPNGYDAGGANWACDFSSIRFNSLRNAVNADALCRHRSEKWTERAIFLVEDGALKFLTVELQK